MGLVAWTLLGITATIGLALAFFPGLTAWMRDVEVGADPTSDSPAYDPTLDT